MAGDLWLFGIGDGERWKSVVLDPGKWLWRGGRTYMAIWKTEEERAAEVRQNKREAKEADTSIAPGVTGGQQRRFRTTFIAPLRPPLGRAFSTTSPH